MTNDEPITADEQTIRQIAREEARDIYDIDVEDGDGETWSLFKLMDSFGIRRRTALKAMGLMALGSSSTVAVLRAMSGSAEGATGSAGQIGTDTDRPDIYGDSADLNSVSIGGAEIGFVLEQVKTVSASGSGTVTLNIDFSSLSEGQYLVAVESDPNFRGPVTATTNYGGAGDYYYYDETGTKQSPVDNWQLLDISDPTRGRLDISITDRIRTSFDLSREINRNLSGFAQLGGMTASGSLDTLTIEFANADSDAYEATLYRRVQL
jgi:hypothetical protein